MLSSYYAGNRQRLYEKLRPGDLLAIFSGEEIRKTNDEYYPFFADRNFVYLTGLKCKQAVLLAAKDEGGAVSVSPQVSKYVYTRGKGRRTGIEGGAAAYNHYVYFADNSGLITCLDLKTAKPVWCFDAGDDTDASIVLEEDDKGTVYL